MEMDDLPNENLKDEILPNLPLPKGGVIIPPFLKGRCEKIKKMLD